MWEFFDWNRLLYVGIIVAVLIGVGLLVSYSRKKKEEENNAGSPGQQSQAQGPVLITCPACGKQVSNQATSCPSCGHPISTQTQPVIQRTWSPGLAAVLSLVIPGAGQMYKGQVGLGLIWLFIVIAGYLLFIIPGLILHIICIVTAASGAQK
jgi:TM2 domain-containing membrane protein YozV